MAFSGLLILLGLNKNKHRKVLIRGEKGWHIKLQLKKHFCDTVGHKDPMYKIKCIK